MTLAPSVLRRSRAALTFQGADICGGGPSSNLTAAQLGGAGAGTAVSNTAAWPPAVSGAVASLRYATTGTPVVLRASPIVFRSSTYDAGNGVANPTALSSLGWYTTSGTFDAGYSADHAQPASRTPTPGGPRTRPRDRPRRSLALLPLLRRPPDRQPRRLRPLRPSPRSTLTNSNTSSRPTAVPRHSFTMHFIARYDALHVCAVDRGSD